MADFPCDMHGLRYPGPATRVYINCYRNDEVMQLKASVCEKDLDVLLDPWGSGVLAKDGDGAWIYQEVGSTLEGAWNRSKEADRPIGRR